jgi:putative transcriptional regulator
LVSLGLGILSSFQDVKYFHFIGHKYNHNKYIHIIYTHLEIYHIASHLTRIFILKYNDVIGGIIMRAKKYNPLRKLPETAEEYGEIKIHLSELIEKREVSLNQLSFRTEMQRSQLRSYRDNKIQRLDIDILKRLCYVLDCDLTDLIEYIPPKKQD